VKRKQFDTGYLGDGVKNTITPENWGGEETDITNGETKE